MKEKDEGKMKRTWMRRKSKWRRMMKG